jgi:hypothetical protein
MEYLKDVNIAILHLGSYTNDKRYGAGDRHLYRTGLVNILNCLTCAKGNVKSRRERGERIIIRKDERDIEIIEEEKIRSCIEQDLVDRCPFRKSEYFERLQCVIISELGFEMAGLKEIAKAFSGFTWDNNLFPLLFYLKIWDPENIYTKELDRRMESDFFEDFSQKIRLLQRILSDRAIEACKKFLDTDGPRSHVTLYHFSLVFMYYMLYSNFDTRTIKICKERNKKIEDDVKTILHRSRGFKKIKDNLGINIYNYLSSLIKDFNINSEISVKVIYKNLERLSKGICNSLEKYREYANSEGEFQSLIDSDLRNYLRFIKSLELSDNDDDSCTFSEYLDVFQKEPLSQYLPLVSLFCDLFKATVSKIKKEGIEPLREKEDEEDEMVIDELLRILSVYSTDKFKVFLSDMGIEISLAENPNGELEVKDAYGGWIEIDSATQEIENGHLILKKKHLKKKH